MRIAAARAALDEVRPGMRLGLGSGRTAEHFVRLLGDKVKAGLRVVGVPTSERTAALAVSSGVPLTTLDETPHLDLAVDGADEIDPGLRLIKGGGGALLREKIVAAAAERMLVVADAGKVVDVLGRFPLPIEVIPFGLGATRAAIERAAGRLGLSGALVLRQRDGKTFETDGGHFILDASFGRIPDPDGLAATLDSLPGVVEHGLFIGLAEAALIGRGGGVDRLPPGG
ncbi:MAG TPA: ribose-5-phosphate isomerase RpiA [Bauldia sp.]|nr:ribose-5-phosphate isomerase RpiA [Bauldia sp.]